MRIAVTGASGFIGKQVIRTLMDAGHQPVIMLRQNSVIPEGMESLTCVRHDISGDPGEVFESLGSPDLLIHLAWGGLPNYRSAHHMEVELPSQFRFLKAMVLAGLPKLVVAGTCFEYGMQSGALDEEAPAEPDNPYGEAKATLYSMLDDLRREPPYDLTWARLFYLYGDGQAETSLYPLLKRAAMAGDGTFPMSGGEQVRDFMAIESFNRDFVGLCLTPGGHGIVNLCSGEPVTVRELVDRWIDENRWSIQPDPGKYPYPDYEPMEFWGVRDKLDSILHHS